MENLEKDQESKIKNDWSFINNPSLLGSWVYVELKKKEGRSNFKHVEVLI